MQHGLDEVLGEETVAEILVESLVKSWSMNEHLGDFPGHLGNTEPALKP